MKFGIERFQGAFFLYRNGDPVCTKKGNLIQAPSQNCLYLVSEELKQNPDKKEEYFRLTELYSDLCAEKKKPSLSLKKFLEGDKLIEFMSKLSHREIREYFPVIHDLFEDYGLEMVPSNELNAKHFAFCRQKLSGLKIWELVFIHGFMQKKRSGLLALLYLSGDVDIRSFYRYLTMSNGGNIPEKTVSVSAFEQQISKQAGDTEKLMRFLASCYE
jgi:hypothetical protein